MYQIHQQQRLEQMDMASQPMSRSQSASSDRAQIHSRLPSLLTPPTSTSLAPAYIAASAASQLVTTDHDSQAYSWFTEDGIAPSGESVLVSPASLNLVNSFLDQLLYNFLCVARSTALGALRSAVLEVLKPTLAREAIDGADQELNEYLGDKDEEDLLELENEQASGTDWDIERVWKQTRLRCMVYSSLGDVEEDDEELYLEQEQINSPSGDLPNAQSGMIPPPVAVFLTSILEFIGEQTLIVAGQAAYQRSRPKRRPEGEGLTSPHDIADRVVVLELDTEKVALNATLGRLWRTWRKRLRSSTTFPSRALSRDSPFRRHYQPSLTSSSRRSSFDHGDGSHYHGPSHSRNLSLAEVLEEDVAANIPLPMTDDDAEEIEVPGLVDRNKAHSMSSRTATIDSRARHRSLTVGPSRKLYDTTRQSSHMSGFEQYEQKRQPQWSFDTAQHAVRPRSNSLPTPVTADFDSHLGLSHDAFVTPMQSPYLEATVTQATILGVDDIGDAQDKMQLAAGQDKSAVDGHGPMPAGREVTQPVEHALMPVAVAEGNAARGVCMMDPADGVPTSKLVKNTTHTPSQSLDGRQGSDGILTAESASRAVPQVITTMIPNLHLSSHTQELPKASESHPNGLSTVVSYSRLRTSSDAPRGITTDEQRPRIDGKENDAGQIGVARTSDSFVPAVDYASPTGSHRPSRDQVRGPQGEASPVKFEDGHRQETLLQPEMRADPAPLPHIASVASSEIATQRRMPFPSLSSEVMSAEIIRQDFAHQQYHAGTEHGPPRLTPLRELMEASADTSDDGSSTGPPQVNGRTVESKHSGERGLNGIGPAPIDSTSNYAHVRQKSSSSKLSDRYHAGDRFHAWNSNDRTSAQRIQSPTMQPREATIPTARRSDSIGRSAHSHQGSDGRARSPVSQTPYGASLITRQQDGLKRHQSSSRSARSMNSSGENRSTSGSDKPSRPSVKSEDKGQMFEQLIKSDQTIQYTLTPQNMREIEAPTPELNDEWETMPTKTSDLADFLRNTGPNESGPRSSATRSNGGSARFASSQSKPPLRMNQSNTSARSIHSIRSPIPSQTGRFIPISTTESTSVSRSLGGGAVARDARVDLSTTKEMAAFLRSTGPDGTTKNGIAVMPPNANMGAKRNQILPSRSASGVSSPTRTGSFTSMDTSRSRTRLVARQATERQTSADLIDFIRRGPPASNGYQMSGATAALPSSKQAVIATRAAAPTSTFARPRSNGRAAGAVIQAPPVPIVRNGFSVPAATVQQGVASDFRSANLRAVHEGAPTTIKHTRFEDEDTVPIRKQRRVRDPYAIDSDSEDDLPDSNPNPRRGEESLMDFLKSVPAPGANATPATIDLPLQEAEDEFDGAAPAPDIARISPPRKTASKRNTLLGMSKGASFGRKQSTLLSQQSPAAVDAASNRAKAVSSPLYTPDVNRIPATAPQLSLSKPGRDSPLFPRSGVVTMKGISGSTSQQSLSTPAAVNASRGPYMATNIATSNRNRALEPRSGNITTSSSDLASFLKNSGPPQASVDIQAQPFVQSVTRPHVPSGHLAAERHRDFAGLRNMFRRKKTAAV